jgi:hypothetical protein
MWEPGHLTNLWASTACYRDSFTFSLQIKRLSHRNLFKMCQLLLFCILLLLFLVKRYRIQHKKIDCSFQCTEMWYAPKDCEQCQIFYINRGSVKYELTQNG